MPSVGGHADAVDARAAHDGDAPAALGPGAEDGEGVVPDEDLLDPAAGRDGSAELVLLARKVDARHQERCDVRDLSIGRPAEGFFDQPGDGLDGALDPDVVW